MMTASAQDLRILANEQEVAGAVERVAREIAAHTDVTGLHMVTILEGGMWFSAALRRAPALADRIANDYRVTAHRTLQDGELGPVQIEPDFEQTVLPSLATQPVLLVDDILDEGKTLHALVELISPVASSIRTAVLIRRARPEGHAIEPDHVGLETEETGWLVGCGMDSEGRYRDLPYVGVRSAAE